MTSAIHSREPSRGLTSDVGFFTDDVVSALDRRKSSTIEVLLVRGGAVRSGWGGSCS
jgi:glycerol kinase